MSLDITLIEPSTGIPIRIIDTKTYHNILKKPINRNTEFYLKNFAKNKKCYRILKDVMESLGEFMKANVGSSLTDVVNQYVLLYKEVNSIPYKDVNGLKNNFLKRLDRSKEEEHGNTKAISNIIDKAIILIKSCSGNVINITIDGYVRKAEQKKQELLDVQKPAFESKIRSL